jgi:hypothetical protein
MLEHSEESVVSNTVGGEDIAGSIGAGLLDVVVLEINEFFVLDCSF